MYPVCSLWLVLSSAWGMVLQFMRTGELHLVVAVCCKHSVDTTSCCCLEVSHPTDCIPRASAIHRFHLEASRMRAPGQKPKEFFGWHKPFLFFISLLCTQFGDQSFLTGLTSCCLSCPAVVLCYLSLCFCLAGLSACLVVMPVVQSFIRIRWPEPTDCISQAPEPTD